MCHHFCMTWRDILCGRVGFCVPGLLLFSPSPALASMHEPLEKQIQEGINLSPINPSAICL